MNMPTPSAQITGSYTSGLKYENFDCSRLSAELDSLARRENQLVVAQEQRVKTSQVQAFWWGFGQGDGVEASELANVRGEKETVRSTMEVKGCGQAKLREEQVDRLKSFLLYYCWIYESKDIDKFATFFAHDAIENGKPFISCLPQYRRNLAKIDSIDYQIKLNRYAIHKGTGLIRMEGTFYFKARLTDSGKWQDNSGNITMELIQSGDSYLVKQLNY
jgi:hypothetical protein